MPEKRVGAQACSTLERLSPSLSVQLSPEPGLNTLPNKPVQEPECVEEALDWAYQDEPACDEPDHHLPQLGLLQQQEGRCHGGGGVAAKPWKHQ